jgi:hypothetical protein
LNTRELVLGYLKGLLQEWYLVAIAIFDFIGLLIQPFLGFEVSTWVHLILFALVFMYANYSLYRDGRSEIVEIKELYEAKLAELGERIANLEDRRPRLGLFFQTEKGFTRHQVVYVSGLPQEPDYDELVRQEAEQIKPPPGKAAHEPLDNLTATTEILNRTLGSLRKSTTEYEKECETYLKRFRQFLAEVYTHELQVARLRSVRFAVQNSGRAPAEVIVLVIKFPDEFHFLSWEELEALEPYRERPEPPQRPTLFKLPFDLLGYSSFSPIMSPGPILPTVDLGSSNVSGPFIKPGNSTEVHYEVQKLLHNFTEVDLDPVQFVVTEEAIGHSWELDYNIHTANLPEPIAGSLLLEVRLAEENQLYTDKANSEN